MICWLTEEKALLWSSNYWAQLESFSRGKYFFIQNDPQAYHHSDFNIWLTVSLKWIRWVCDSRESNWEYLFPSVLMSLTATRWLHSSDLRVGILDSISSYGQPHYYNKTVFLLVHIQPCLGLLCPKIQNKPAFDKLRQSHQIRTHFQVTCNFCSAKGVLLAMSGATSL